MGTLVITDLPESVELDQQAMTAITGGSKVHAQQTMLAPQTFTGLRIGTGVAGIGRTPIAEAVATRARITTLLR